MAKLFFLFTLLFVSVGAMPWLEEPREFDPFGVTRTGDPDDSLDLLGQEPHPEPMEDESRNFRATDNLGTGNLTTTIGTGDDIGRGAVIQTDGSLVIVGRYTKASDSDFFIARYLPDGPLDLGFNSTGILTYSFSTSDDVAHAVAVQTDGRILAFGRTDRLGILSFDYGVVRINSNGLPDTSFNTTGRQAIDINGTTDIARSGALQTDGKILIGGYTSMGGPYWASLVRLNSNGSLDTSFRTTGSVILSFTTSTYAVTRVQQDALGNIVVTGPWLNGTKWNSWTARYLSDGSVDTSFNTTGSVSQSVSTGGSQTYALASDTLGRVVVAGSSNVGNLDLMLIRYATNGTLDTSFNVNGIRTTSFGTADDGVYALSFQSDGRLLAGGYSRDAFRNNFTLWRVNTNGSNDTSFSTVGAAFTAVVSNENTALALATRFTGNIVLAGRTNNGSNYDVSWARYAIDGSPALSGTLDKSWGTSGYTSLTFTTNFLILNPLNLMSVPGDKVTSCGYRSGVPAQPGCMRYTIDGGLDTSFGTVGFLFTTLSTGTLIGATIQSDGRIIGGGSMTLNKSGDTPSIERFHTNGLLDTSFNTTGINKTSIPTMAGLTGYANNFGYTVATDGRMYALGMWYDSTTRAFGVVQRFNSDGSFDTSFRTVGWASFSVNTSNAFGVYTNNPHYIEAIEEDRLLLIAEAGNMSYAIRFISNGVFDTSFNTTGFSLITGGNNLRMLTGRRDNVGRLIMGGQYNSGTFDYITVRLNTDGTYDTSWNSIGRHTFSLATGSEMVYASQIQKNNKIIFCGVGYGPGSSNNEFVMFRYNTNGTLDTSFATRGIVMTSLGTNSSFSSITFDPVGRILCGGTNVPVSGAAYEATIGRFWP